MSLGVQRQLQVGHLRHREEPEGMERPDLWLFKSLNASIYEGYFCFPSFLMKSEVAKSGSPIEVRQHEWPVPSVVAVPPRARPAGLALLLAGPRLSTRREGIGRSRGICQFYRCLGESVSFYFILKLQINKCLSEKHLIQQLKGDILTMHYVKSFHIHASRTNEILFASISAC